MRACVLALAGLAVASAAATNTTNTTYLSLTQQQFDGFMLTYGKAYPTNEEYFSRLTVFRANLQSAELLTGSGVVHGVTKFADLTPAEFKSMYTGYKAGSVRAALGDAPVAKSLRAGAPPTAVDWRSKGVITPVKDQGQCGSCWAFSTVEEIETDWIMAGNKQTILSPQQIVDCDKQDAGCDGGDTITAYAYVKKNGLETEAAYPYTSGVSAPEAKCSYNAAKVAVEITGFKYGTSEGNEALLQSNVADIGPMSLCLATGGWQTYVSGVLTAKTCGKDVDHCVQVVGYNTGGSSGNYWIVRNSWGLDWGVDGYIYLALGTNTCDLTGEATYVKVA